MNRSRLQALDRIKRKDYIKSLVPAFAWENTLNRIDNNTGNQRNRFVRFESDVSEILNKTWYWVLACLKKGQEIFYWKKRWRMPIA
jgi:hypothetical protein